MRVLVAHNRYLQPGGEDVVVRSEIQLLRDLGWEVERFEVSNERVAELGLLKTGLRTSWSRDAARAVGERLDAGRHDLLHVHNWFPLLSPAIHWAAARRRVPVVQTLHNYRLLCIASSLYRDGHRCTDCLGRALPWPGVAHRCYRESASASLALATALTLHRVIGTWSRKVSLFVALSERSRQTLTEGGLPAERIVVKPNFVDPDPGPGGEARHFALYASRLVEGKGIGRLLSVWPHRGARLVIAGDGPLAPEVAAAVQAHPSIEWRGNLPREEVLQRLGEAAFLVMPSMHAEGCPLVILEAFCRGTPVIAMTGGGCEELIEDGRTGLLVPPGEDAALGAAVRRLVDDPEEARRMGRAARRTFERRFTRQQNGVLLRGIYERALALGIPSGLASNGAGGGE